jgi:hypothetical protein
MKTILPLAPPPSAPETLKHRLERDDRDEKAFADPHFLFHQGSGIVMDQINDLFPAPSGRETTSL